jgi:hypothetical protein
MKIKRYNDFISEEIINMTSWPSLGNSDKNGYVLPMLLWVSDVCEGSFKEGDYESKISATGVKLVKKWALEGGLSGSYFRFESDGRGIIFTHLNEVNLEFCDSKPSGYQLPKDFESRSISLFEKYSLGSPIFATVVKDFEDGVKVVTTGSNWHLIKKLGIKRLGISTYKGFVKELNIPLYSDDTQTPESKEAIWKKLLQDESCEIVGWSQNKKVELPIEMIDGNPYYKGGIPIYFGDAEINQQTLDLAGEDEDKYLKMKSMTKNLKLKSVK